MSASVSFNASLFVTEQINRQLVNLTQDVVLRSIKFLSEHYNFDYDEAISLLNVKMLKVERKTVSSKEPAKSTAIDKSAKSAFPLPYCGEFNESCCFALKLNSGLYTQCSSARKHGSDFCKACANKMQKSGDDVPEYGTIQQRRAVGVFEFVDPKGRKPTAYAKVMKKYKVDKEDVLREAEKFGLDIDEQHFANDDTKRGRPKSADSSKSSKKGRPRKTKDVVVNDDDTDMFANLVAEANKSDDDDKPKKSIDLDDVFGPDTDDVEPTYNDETLFDINTEDDGVIKVAPEEKKYKRKTKKTDDDKELAAEAKKKAAAEKKAAKEKDDVEKKAAKKKADAEKKTAKDVKNKKAVVEETPAIEETNVVEDNVKKFTYEGKAYIRSKNSGIVYDYDAYKNDDQEIAVGKWNATTEKIDFIKKEYDMSEDDDSELSDSDYEDDDC